MTKVSEDHSVRKVTREIKVLTARKEMLVKKANEDHKAYKEPLVWKVLKVLKASKDLEVKLDLPVRQAKRENLEFLGSLAILVHPERRVTKARLVDQEHPETKEIEVTLEHRVREESRGQEVLEVLVDELANKA